MDSEEHPPTLVIVVDGQNLNVTNVAQTRPHLVREVLIQALIHVPLEELHLTRIQLQEHFRHSLTARRNHMPYRLASVIHACRGGLLDPASLEARFYCHGRASAVAAYAATAADQKNVVPLLENLSNNEFDGFLRVIDKIEPHDDLQYLTGKACRATPRAESKQTVAGPRKRRVVQRPSPSQATLDPTISSPQTVAASVTSNLAEYHQLQGPHSSLTTAGPSSGLSAGPADPESTVPALGLQLSDINNLSRFTLPHYHSPLIADNLDQFTIPHMFADQAEGRFRALDEETGPFDFSGPGYSE